MKKVCKLVVLLVLFTVACKSKTPELSEAAQQHLLALYSKAALYQVDVTNAQNRFNDAAKEYNDLVAKTIEDNKLPKGTIFQPDIQKNKVTVVLPEDKKDEKKDEKKPEAGKKQ